jgi:hypothetical protein
MKRLAALVLFFAAACSNKKTPVPGTPCVIKSDCNDPLSCTFGLCHEACRRSSDCPSGQRCVLGFEAGQSTSMEAGNLRVCLLEEKATCALNSMCNAPLVCGRDLQCRNECAEDRDCADENDRCVVGGPNGEKVCAEPAAIVNGALKTGSDGGVTADATPASWDASSAADAGRDTADAGPNCGVTEMEPNEQRENATPFSSGTTVVACNGAATDIDYYELTTPAGDAAGGYYQASITDVGDGALTVRLYSASDNGQIHVVQSQRGMSLGFYWAGAPGQKYHVAVSRASGTLPFKYMLKVVYAKIDDPFEPNDTRETPRMLALGTPVMAYFFTGFKTYQIQSAEYEDWFSLELAPGVATVKIEGVAANARLQFRVFDATNAPVNPMGNTAAAAGADVNGMFPVMTAGTYRIVVGHYGSIASATASGTGAMIPESYTRPYKLTVAE